MKYKNFTGPNVALTGGFVGGTPIANFPPFQPNSYRFNGSFSPTADDASVNAIWFRPDGTKVFYAGPSTDRIYQRTLSTPWDITSVGSSTSSGAITTNISGISFDDINGDKVLVIDSVTNTISKYTLSTAWDVTSLNTTAAQTNNSALVGRSTPTGIWARSNGTLLLVANAGTSASLTTYNASTGWDLSTLSLNTTTGLSGIVGANYMSNGNELMFVTNGTMINPKISAAYGLNWATTVDFTTLISPQVGSQITDIYFKNDGSGFYITQSNGTSFSTIYQWIKR